MCDLVPVIYQQELDTLKAELSGMFISVIFDGTTRYGEAMATLTRYIDAKFCIQQRSSENATARKEHVWGRSSPGTNKLPFYKV